jgi:hypothetical protein
MAVHRGALDAAGGVALTRPRPYLSGTGDANHEADMHRILLTALALTLAATVTADAAAKKKSGIHRPTVATKHVKHRRVVRPAYQYGQPSHQNQGWPTSWSDGSFSYGGWR